MKKIILILAILYLQVLHLNAQNLIAVQNVGQSTFYSNIDSAITYAQAGDTIYFPGGNFNLGSYRYVIHKRLYLIGAGHNLDSCQATGITYISGNIDLEDSADGSMLAGIYLTGDIYIGDGFSVSPTAGGVGDVKSITITRCNIGSVFGNYSANGSCCGCYSNINLSNYLINENVIRGNINGVDGNGNLFANNIIEGTVQSLGQNSFQNNIFLYEGNYPGGLFSYHPIGEVRNAVVKDNIFISTTLTIGGSGVCTYMNNASNSNFLNNLFVETVSSPYCSSCLDYNNYSGVSPVSLFINQSGNVFSYGQNYHLQNPLLYSGTDGTQVGIYGGMFPWKEGSSPFNPHISYQSIPSNTNANGNLPVNIRIQAQDH